MVVIKTAGGNNCIAIHQYAHISGGYAIWDMGFAVMTTKEIRDFLRVIFWICLLYTSDAADER